MLISAPSGPRPLVGSSAATGIDKKTTYEVVVVNDEAGLRQHLAAWEDLVRHAAEPNPFYEPWALLPALRAFAVGLDLSFVLVYLPINAQRRQPVLCGFFPLSNRRLHRLLPVRVISLWRHLYCFLCIPLLRAGHTIEVLDAFFDWLTTDPRGGPLWEMERTSGDGSFARALAEVCWRRRRIGYAVELSCRALLEVAPDRDADAYLGEALARKRLNDIRRRQRQLAAGGKLERRLLEPGGDVDAWVDQFLALEAAGWKGRRGTAIRCREGDAAFFRELAKGAFARGQLMMLGLFLDGRPVALKCNLLAAPGSFAFKIAFDEAFAAFSPGVLLEVANIELLHERRPVRWMDSCAIAGHFMINRLWTQRRLIHTQVLATGRTPGDLLISLMPLGRWLKRLVRGCPPHQSHVPEEE